MKLKDLFLPTVSNDQTPHLLQRAAILAMCCLVFLSFAAVNLLALLWQSSSWLVGTVLPAVVVDLTNVEREKLVTPELRRSAVLDEAARLKAEDMAKKQYFAHYSPEGVSPWYWFDQVSYQYAHAGENLAIHFTDSGSVIDAWMKSPLHRANIVNKNYTEIGVGTAKGMFDGYETVYVVQLFATPAAIIQPTAVIIDPVAVVSKDLPRKAELTTDVMPPELPSVAAEAVVLGDTADFSNESEEDQPEATDIVLIADKSVITEVEAPVVADDMRQEALEKETFSTYMATSSGLLPDFVIENAGGTTEPYVSALGALATQPSALLQGVYLIVGFLVAVLLLLSIVISLQQEKPQQVVYGIALLCLMSGLFYLHSILITPVVIASETQQNIAV